MTTTTTTTTTYFYALAIEQSLPKDYSEWMTNGNLLSDVPSSGVITVRAVVEGPGPMLVEAETSRV